MNTILFISGLVVLIALILIFFKKKKPKNTTVTTTISTNITTLLPPYNGEIWKVMVSNDNTPTCSGTLITCYAIPGSKFDSGTILWLNKDRTNPFKMYNFAWDSLGNGNVYSMLGQVIGTKSGVCPV